MEKVKVIIEEEATLASKRERKLSLADVVRQRFSDAPWSKKRTITVGGAGGIGSNVLYVLFKHGHDIILYEYDSVEGHNIGGQMYNILDIGHPKATGMCNLKNYIDPDISVRTMGKFTPGKRVTPITISCFDNMQARKDLFEEWVSTQSNLSEAMFLDGRMNALSYEVYTVLPKDIDKYRETLFLDAEVEDLPCNFKATTQTGLLCAGTMIAAMTNVITNFVTPELCDVPFKIEFNTPLMSYETTN